MKKLNEKFDNENGSALVLVMMVLVVVSALGGALGMVTINSHRLAENTQDTNSAYYIAEAGANMAYEEFKTHVLSAYETYGTKGDFDREVEVAREDIDNTIYGESYFPSNDSDKIEAVIEVIKLEDEESTHVIRSTGKVDGKTRTVVKPFKVSWKDEIDSGISLPVLPGDSIIVSRNEVIFDQNTTITGDIHIDKMTPGSLTISPHTNFNGTVFFHPDANMNSATNGPKPKSVNRDAPIPWDIYLELVDFKQYSDKYNQEYEVMPPSKLVNNIINFDKNYSIDELKLTGDKIINTNGLEVTIVVNNLIFDYGTFNFENNSRVNIYVKNKIDFISGGTSINYDGSPNNLKIFYAGTETLNLGHNNSKMNAAIVVENAPIHIKGAGTPTSKGVILTSGKVLNFSDNARYDGVIVAPTATTTLIGSSSMIGQLITDTLKADQRDYSKLVYNQDFLIDFPFGVTSNADDENVNLEDIISSKPATEN